MGKKRVSRSEYDRRLARRRATGRPRQTRVVRHDIQSSALTVAQLASDVQKEIDILKAEISAGQRTLEEKERFLANLLSAAGIQRASENGMRVHRTIRYDEVIPWLHATLRAEGNRAFAVEIYRRAQMGCAAGRDAVGSRIFERVEPYTAGDSLSYRCG